MEFLNLEKCSLPSAESCSASYNSYSAREEDKDFITEMGKVFPRKNPLKMYPHSSAVLGNFYYDNYVSHQTMIEQ